MTTRTFTVPAIALGLGLALSACTTTPAATPGEAHDDDHAVGDVQHVHVVIVDPLTERIVLGTHDGLVVLDDELGFAETLGGHHFDAMGLAVSGDTLVASGHPGADTPAEWGTPHLGIIVSDDSGADWESVAYPGEKDFHALASAPDGTLYGVATDDARLVRSTDGGAGWEATGSELATSALTTDSEGALYATSEEGVLVSLDGGASFGALNEAPLLYLLAGSPDREQLVGVDVEGAVWVRAAGSGRWQQVGTAAGRAQAVAISADDRVILVDEAGISAIPLDG